MSERDERGVSRIPHEVILKMLAAATGVGVGVTIGPVPGAFAAAGVEPVIEAVARYVRRADTSAALFISKTGELSGCTPEELAGWADTDERLELLASALSAAWATLSEQRVDALARVVAETVQDDAMLDVAPLYVSALGELLPAHIRVLTLIADGENIPEPSAREAGQTGGDEWSTDHLGRDLPGLEAGMDSLVAQLNRVGCISLGRNRLDGGSWWTVTPFGDNCLSYLTEGAGSREQSGG